MSFLVTYGHDPAEAHRLRALYPKMAYCRAPGESLQSIGGVID